MANITKTDDDKCYSCGKQCINVEFCNEGASYDSSEDGGISLSRNLKVKIIANPEFWGFSGVLISGWATFTNGYYDFFDGRDDEHLSYKTCGSITSGPFKNEARPDIMYRSVYIPDSGTVNYGSDGTVESKVRGGPEAYLIDRPKGLITSVSSDSSSCDTSNPATVFKKFPENFGWANKIHFKNEVYKNITGAWRLSSLESCYPQSSIHRPSGLLLQCDGSEKQNIIYKDRKFEKYDKFITRSSGNNCIQDGAVAGEYSGSFGPSGIFRDLSQSPFLQAHITYNNGAASGVRNGASLYIENDVNSSINGIYTVFDTSHSGSFTSVKFVGTHEGSYTQTLIGTSGQWISLNSFDENTCCSNAAYGVGLNKIIEQDNFHTDFRRVFNNPKNIRQSNRDIENRVNYGYSIVPSGSGYRKDVTYPSLDNNGNVIISGGFPLFERELPYYGSFLTTDVVDSGIRSDDRINRMIARNGTCYSKHATLEIFPDCITQYARYNECTTNAEKYQTNRVPRLAFVYRGCDFNDSCSFDASGRPIAAWSGGSPANIDDLKRGLGGQEIHMFINLSDAWAGKTQDCPCDCSEDPPPGQMPPDHVIVPSPISYPAFPNFDLNPVDYGCSDPYHQLHKYRRILNTGILTPSEQCDPIHTFSECCNIRQPYTTYGYIMNLCGKETQDRKKVISEAFAKYTQEKTYTHLSTGININEPMYWGIECPVPEPYSVGSGWSSGVTGDDRLVNIHGETYGYWGLSDENGLIVSPYFRTEAGYKDCCSNDGIPDFIEFSESGTFFNGWPTSSVPFLIEVEVDDLCTGCATSNMPDTSLSLQIESLDAKYIHGFGLASNDAYGFNHCGYSDDYIVSIGPPGFTCASGFNEDYCVDGDALHQEYGVRYAGSTCDCVNGTEISLSPVFVKDTSIVKGFISNSITNSIVEISGCNKTRSNYLEEHYADEFANSPEGFSVFGRFTLTCAGMQSYLQDPIYPDAKYNSTSDFLSLLWSNSDDCAIHKPAKVGSDVIITSKLWAVRSEFRDLFKKIPEAVIDRGFFDIETPISMASFTGINNIFGLCPGDKVYSYGCMVSGDYYGCHNPCPTGTLCTTCPTGTGSGEVICNDCGDQIGYDQIRPRFVPYNLSLNSCGCLCSEPTLIAEYEINPGWTLTITSGNPVKAACADVYWMGASGNNGVVIGPTILNPSEKIGLDLGTYTAYDWFDFSHSINSVASGITHRLNAPTTSDCGSMSISSCESNTSCASDPMNGSATCGTQIYGTGDYSVSVNKMKCHPEVAIVTKIDCLGSGYKLYVSREYHEHDRTWYEKIVNGDGDPVCVAKYAGSYTYAGSCTTIPYANPADSVTPAYNSPCSVNPPSGTHVTQDFQFDNKPVSSGDTIWNYYNLFYEGVFPTSYQTVGQYSPSVNRDIDGNFECLMAGSFTGMPSIFGSGDFLTPSGYFGTTSINAKHSCVQDIVECGGSIWCSKLFFPRHSYLSGTKISAFGSPSICLSNNQFSIPGFLGYEGFANPLENEQELRYVDWCNENNKVSALTDIGIDSTEIIVDDYLPLLGISHPGWRYTRDVKSCTVVSSGCDGYSLPTHTDYTIRAGIHSPTTFYSNGFESMGYYLDKSVASGADNCLFSPFKIMIDVECSTNNIRRKGVGSDDPTMLTAYSRFPSTACRGLISDAPCECADSQCRHYGTETGGSCKRLAVAGYSGILENVSYLCSGSQSVCVDCPSGSFSVIRQFASTSVLDEDLLSAATSISGIYNSCQDCSIFVPPSGSVVQNRCFGLVENMSDWRVGCDGVYYKIVGYKYTHEWTCDYNKYINPSLYGDLYDTECECESDWTKGLCGATKRSSIDSVCDIIINDWQDVPEEYPYTGGQNLWWKECGCVAKPRSENPCYSDSMVKMIITEGI